MKKQRLVNTFGVALAVLAPLVFTHGGAATASTESDVSCDLSAQISFREGAPRDSFQFSHTGSAAWNIESIRLDLQPSAGKLLFDTESGGKGVEVFQLFKLGEGTAVVGGMELPDDGTYLLQVSFEKFSAGDTFSFSIDVDDQLDNSDLGQIRVSGGEIAGAIVDVEWNDGKDEQVLQRWLFDSNKKGVPEKTNC